MKIFKEINWFLKRKALANIKLIILDADGVLTDGSLYYGKTGELIKKFDVKDGLGIKFLQKNMIDVAIISGGAEGAINIRAKNLSINHCLTNAKDKTKEVKFLRKTYQCKIEEVAFLGDDLNDLVVKKEVGLLIATNDASPILKKRSDLILDKKGGDGAVRELSERILSRSQFFSSVSKLGWKDKND
tara:strand:+ start:11222 stop:11782 length:561 start_codon:yes stop_codon:yes gene_type:complete